MSGQAVTTRTPATIVDSQKRAEALAEHLLDPARSKPVIVVTTAAGHSQPYIDVDQILDAVRELADVYVVPIGNITLGLSDLLPGEIEVYGGAGRVYPVDRAWRVDPYAAPLRFAYGPDQGPAATDLLIADALGAVNRTDRIIKHAASPLQHVEGEVKALIAPSRAWVQIDDGRQAAIWQDLLRPGMPLERTFQVGMRVSGVLDVEECRIDVSASERNPGDALADYGVGSVVLVRVVKVDDIAAVLELYPGMRTGMSAREVTGNPDDGLTALMSVDEVLPVQVTSRGGYNGRGWRLSTVDVEVAGEIMVSPSLLPGGPPWLVMAAVAPEAAIVAPTGATVAPRTQLTEQSAGLLNAVPKPLPAAADEMASLRRQIEVLDGLLLNAQTLEQAIHFERDGFREQAGESNAQVQQLVRSAKKAKTDLRLEKQNSQRLEKQVRLVKAENADVLFLDPEVQFRYEVGLAYAQRIPARDKAARPRREISLGPDFLATLSSFADVDRYNVVALAVEIITDLVNELEGRELHSLREGVGAAERDVVRLVDGARCMRVALQGGTPSAVRLHFWKVGEAIELSRVVKQDDLTP